MSAGLRPSQPHRRPRMGWDSNTYYQAPLPKYDALQDSNLRTHYEKRSVRDRLYESHLVDKAGRILRLNKTKVSIIEQEFKTAERSDAQRLLVDAYEKRKLESKKKWLREDEMRKRRSQHLREREHSKRDTYHSKLAHYLPQPMLPGSRHPASTLASRHQLKPSPPGDRARSARTARSSKRDPSPNPSTSSSSSAGVDGSPTDLTTYRSNVNHKRARAAQQQQSSRPTTAPSQQARPDTAGGTSASTGGVSDMVKHAYHMERSPTGTDGPYDIASGSDTYDDGGISP